MSDLEKLKKKRAVIRQITTKLLTKIENSLLDENKDEKLVDDLHDLRNQLLVKVDILRALDSEVEALMDSNEEFETEIMQSQDYQERAIIYKGKLERFLVKIDESRSESVVINGCKSNLVENMNSDLVLKKNSYDAKVVKLPKLVISKFYGDSSSYLDFWNQYEIAIHNNDCLSKIEKFNYLKMYLGGNALSAVSGFSLTNENYDSSIELLKERFGRQDLIISCHMNKLLAIEQVKYSSNVKALRKLYDECEVHIRSLQSLKVTAGSYGNLLCPVILQKLPEDLNLEYNRKRKLNSEFNINELIEFIRKEVECREASHVLSNSSKSLNDGFYTQPRGRTEYQNKPNYQRRGSSASALMAASNMLFCIFCNNKFHETKNCPLPVDERKASIRKEFRCFRCLKKGHVSKKCWSRIFCSLCNHQHNYLICDKDKSLMKEAKTEIKNVMSSVSAACVANDPVLLQTSLAILKYDRKNKLVRLLYDSGSHRSFVKRCVCNELNLDTIRTERLHIYGFGDESSKQCSYELVQLKLQNKNDSNLLTTVEALAVDKITYGNISAPTERVKEIARKMNIDLSDTGEISDVDILIGADYLFEILFDRSLWLDQKLVATDSLFGFVVHGRTRNDYHNSCVSVNHATLSDIDKDVKLFWELEGLGIDIQKEQTVDNQCEMMNVYRSNLKFESNRYSVNLLWKPDSKHMLSNNFKLASERFIRLCRRFRNDPYFFKKYRDVIEDYERQGIIERVGKDENIESQVQFYLPHRAVIRNDKATSKVRIVFDGSAHMKNELSLNDCLHIGPNLYPDIFQLILAFRENPIAFTADIKQAFLQIGIHEEDRDVTRFFWTENPQKESSTVIYRFCRVLFGINCSPFLLAATIKEHIKKYVDTHPSTFELLNRNVYVDDVVGGSCSIETAFKTSLECIEIFSDAGMLLRKWQTNNVDLREQWKASGVPIQDKSEVIGQTAFPFKVLGVSWDPDSDFLFFDCENLLKIVSNRERCTKRFLLQVAGRIFDPAGFLGPFTIRLKCFIQSVWEKGLEWDQELNPELELSWKELCNDLSELKGLNIPRYYFFEIENKSVKSVELHLFSDASLKAYGTVAYLRIITNDGLITTSFIAAKSRVAPLKRQTLPRLELLGAVLSARLSKSIVSSLKHSVTLFFWCDSSIVCCWVKTPAINFKQFIRNRVKEIQSLTQSKDWFHCPGKDNPADLISRGTSIVGLKNSSLWWKGPHWLQQHTEFWPKEELTKARKEELEYSKKIVVSECVIDTNSQLLDISDYSKLNKAIRITAWVNRFLKSARKIRPKSDTLTAEELQDAEDSWIKIVQKEAYQPELQALQKSKSVLVNSAIYSLSPFIDDKGILRITGRLGESDCTFDEKKPIILPRESKFTELIVKQIHEETLHSGVSSTLVQIRKKYWIPKGRQLVKKIVFRCLICKKYAARPADQLTAQLPKDRISETPPFTVCGVDFTGPVYVKIDNNITKSYITLFTCAVTRAVHLELVTDMSTSKFLLAFRRFLSRRGICHTIYSDNAKTFKSADRELRKLYDLVENSEFKDFIALKRISWKYIVERAPWWGGFYERLMRNIKETLRKILGKALLSFEEMSTVLTEIENILNCRPLTYVCNEAGEPEPLTPAHFLQIGRESISYPVHIIESLHKTSTAESLTRRKKYQSKVISQVWNKWKREYLLHLRSANSLKTPTPRSNLKKNDVVLLEGTSKSKLLWDLGVIEDVYQGRDGLVRSCIVRTSKGQYKRPVQLLYPLEINELT